MYKILLITHHCIYKNALESVAALVTISDSQRTIRLVETKYESSYGARAFSHAGPKLWNLLPNNICLQSDTEKFKKMLKTFLMTQGEEYLSRTKMKWFWFCMTAQELLFLEDLSSWLNPHIIIIIIIISKKKSKKFENIFMRISGMFLGPFPGVFSSPFILKFSYLHIDTIFSSIG